MSEDSTSNTVYHIIHLHVFDGLDYYIQVRQAPASDVPEFRDTGDRLNVLEPMINKFNMNTNQQLYDVLIDQFTPGVASRSGIIVSKGTFVDSAIDGRLIPCFV